MVVLGTEDKEGRVYKKHLNDENYISTVGG